MITKSIKKKTTGRKDAVTTIIDTDDLPIPVRKEEDPPLVLLTQRLRGLSSFAWGLIVGVAMMSVLFGLALLLLFRSLT